MTYNENHLEMGMYASNGRRGVTFINLTLSYPEAFSQQWLMDRLFLHVGISRFNDRDTCIVKYVCLYAHE